MGYSMGADPAGSDLPTVNITVRALQRELVRAGFDIGRSGVDGLWGPATKGALDRALARTGLTGGAWRYSASRDRVTLTAAAWSAIGRLPAGAGGERQSRTRRPSSPSSPPATEDFTVPVASQRAGMLGGVPLWAWGLLGAAGVGVWLYTRKPRRAAA